MFYELLGRVVWFAAKRYVRHKYGRTHLPKPLLAAAALAFALVVAILGQRAQSD